MISKISIQRGSERQTYEFRRDTIVIGAGSRSDIVVRSRRERVRLLTLHVTDSGFRVTPGDPDDDLQVRLPGDSWARRVEDRLIVPKGTEIFVEPGLSVRLEDLVRERRVAHQALGPLEVAPTEACPALLGFAYHVASAKGLDELASALAAVCEARDGVSFLQVIVPEGEPEPWDRQVRRGPSPVQLVLGTQATRQCGGLGELRRGEVLACERDSGITCLVPVTMAGGELGAVLHLDIDELHDRFAEQRPWLAGVATLVAAFVQRHALERREAMLRGENQYFRERQRRHYLYKKLAARSPAMREVHRRLGELVSSHAPVLLTGEAGTGKQLLARALHHLGGRQSAMMIAQHCGTLDEDVLDVELFGIVNNDGSSTRGIMELADGGTVFLDEVHALSDRLQAKLHRVLVEGEVFRNGDTVGRSVDVRVVASTHRDLDQLAREGHFRRDLALLLGRNVLRVPPLRERVEDVPTLVQAFIKRYARRYRRSVREVSPETLQWLASLRWPGNVRELQSVIEHAVLDIDPDVEVLTRAHFELH